MHREPGRAPFLSTTACPLLLTGLLVVLTAQGSCGGSPAACPPAGAESDAGSDGAPTVPFTIVALDRAGIGSIGSAGWANVGQASAGVDWKQGPFTQVTLVVDLESACFPFTKWSADPPPAGENWPADCDAFDRNFNVFLDDFEVIHAITPFGGPEHLEVDLTDMANGLPGQHTLRADLASYPDGEGLVTGSNGGWTVSSRVEVTPGPAPRHVLTVIPLYAGAISAGDPFPVIAWEVPAETITGRLEYRTSGHGQGTRGPRCAGPAEEFCDRRHQILVDGSEVDNIEPYRQDCQTLCTMAHEGPADAGFDYCEENPCGAIDSVRASRANWCPGSMTAPFIWANIPALALPGSHTFSFQIRDIIPGGTWQASAIYTAYGP
jgi:Peptide-N-glycosidase F, C terminal